MTALSRETVFTGYLTGATGPVAAGKALVFNTAGTRMLVSTLANRTSTGRPTAGIAVTAGDNDDVAVEVQFVGPLPPSISGLGTGTATTVYVADDGSLARGGVEGVNDIVGECDTDGTVYLLCGGIYASGGGGGGGGGAPADAQYVVMAANGTLTDERVLTAGTGINITDGGAGGNVTITNTGAPVGASYVTLALDSTLSSERVLTAGAGISVTDNGANGTVVIAATGGSFTPPTGTGFAHVTSGALDPAATANIRYTGGKFQTDGNIQWLNGAITGDLVWAPTSSNKTITLQDATGTVVLRDTTDTLTNKTVNATNNTITDTSTSAGDLLKSNGTKFVRFARGTAGHFLRTNAGGTDLEWAAVSTLSVAGSASEIQINSGSSTLAAATNVTAGSGFIAVGSGTKSTTGAFRFPYTGAAVTSFISVKDSTNTDRSILNVGTGDSWTLGPPTAAAFNGTVQAASLFTTITSTYSLSVASTDAMVVTSANGIRFGYPVAGNASGSKAFRFKTATITVDGDETLTASQYECPILLFTGSAGGTRTITVPTDDGELWLVLNESTSTLSFNGATSIASEERGIVFRVGGSFFFMKGA